MNLQKKLIYHCNQPQTFVFKKTFPKKKLRVQHLAAFFFKRRWVFFVAPLLAFWNNSRLPTISRYGSWPYSDWYDSSTQVLRHKTSFCITKKFPCLLNRSICQVTTTATLTNGFTAVDKFDVWNTMKFKASCSRSSKIFVSPVKDVGVWSDRNIDWFLRSGSHVSICKLPKYAKKELIYWKNLPCWELTYPTYEKGKSSGSSYL